MKSSTSEPAAPAPDPGGSAALPGAISRDAEGWVTSSPPKAVEVAQRVLGFPRTVVVHRDLILTSVKRELDARFTGTVLGLLWPLLHPVLMFAVYFFIFTKLLNVKFPSLPEEQQSAMGVFMFVGIAIWASVGDSLVRCCSAIVDNGNLIKKLVFPAEVLPLNIVLVNLVTMMFAVVVFVLVTLVTPVWQAPDPAMLLWIPLLLVIQLFFAYGLGLFLSTLHVFLRDTMQVVSVAVTVWMFLTPIFWAPELIIGFENGEIRPVEGSAIEPYLDLVRGNPTYHLVYAWRTVLMSEEPGIVFGTFGDTIGNSVMVLAAWSAVLFVLGYAFFIVAQRRFADEV